MVRANILPYGLLGLFHLHSVPAFAALYYPNPQIHFLEHILVDNGGAYASNFSSAITPCNNYVSEANGGSAGRTTVAQWIRSAFRDFITADVTAGTGGIDASFGFETAGSAAGGSAWQDSLNFWRPFVNDAVSMADIIAMGTVMAMALCGRKNIPFLPGRIDASQAGSITRSPSPFDDLNTTMGMFVRARFNQADTIALTACGHSVGSVHASDLPTVVSAQTVTDQNRYGGAHFDPTQGQVDIVVAREYVESSGNMGGPLVTSTNTAARSDLRLYMSDGNTTMQSLYDAGDDGFMETCGDVLGRMINTVPSNVRLKEAITAFEIKPVNVTFDLDGSDRLVLSGRVRVLRSNVDALPGQIQTSLVCNGRQDAKSTVAMEQAVGTSVYGSTAYYPLNLVVDASRGYKALRISGKGIKETTFAVGSTIFVVPSLTSISGTHVNVTVAVKTGNSPSSLEVTVAAPTIQNGTIGPRILKQKINTSRATSASAAGYDLWEGSVNLGVAVTGAVSITTGPASDQAMDVLYLDGAVAGW